MRGQLQPAVVVLQRHIFAIGLIEHQQHVGRQGGMQPGDLAPGEKTAGRIVRVGDEDQPRALIDQRQQRIDIGAVILIGRDHWQGPAAADDDIVEREAIADIDRLVARPGKGAGGDGEQFARAGAAQDPRGVDAMQRAQSFAQGNAVGVGIERGHHSLFARHQGLGAGAQRVLVGRELDQRAAVIARRFAGDIGVDRGDPGLGDGGLVHGAAAHSRHREELTEHRVSPKSHRPWPLPRSPLPARF